MSKHRSPISWVDPSAFRTGAEWIKSSQHLKEPRDGYPLHAHWFPIGLKFHPSVERGGISTDMRVKAWCGTRLRLVLEEPFDPKSGRACPACVEWMRKGYPAHEAPSAKSWLQRP